MPPLPYWRLSALYFFYYWVLGIWYPFWGLYLSKLGYDSGAIGIFYATILIPRAIAPYFFGHFWTQSAERLPLIRFCFLCAFLSCGLMVYFSGTLWLAIAGVLISFFWCGVIPQIDMLTLGWHRGREYRYSRVRLWGSCGFIFSVLFCGLYFRTLPITHLPVLLLCSFFVLLLSAFFVSSHSLDDSEREIGKISSSGHFRWDSPQLLCFFGACFLMYFSHGSYNAFYTIYLSEVGHDSVMISMLWSLGVSLEVLLFFFWPWALQHVRLERLLFWSAAAILLRWIIIAFSAGHIVPLLVAQLLHGVYYCCFHASAIEWIRRYFPADMAGRGQSLYYALSFGLGGAVGTWVSGWLWPQGVQSSFLAMALLGLCALWFLQRALDNPLPQAEWRQS